MFFVISDMKNRAGSRTAATSKTELFVIIVNGFQALTVVTSSSILDVAAVLDPPLKNANKVQNSTFFHNSAK